MSDLKKGKMWYDDMPDHIQCLWLYNIADDQFEYIWDMYFEHFVDFLSESFVWNDTIEGFEFWLEVSSYNFAQS